MRIVNGHKIEPGAYLSGADLSGANLSGATGLPVLLDNDGRGYNLRSVPNTRYVTAGCRTFTIEEAVTHWLNPEHVAPQSAALLLAACQRYAFTLPPKKAA